VNIEVNKNMKTTTTVRRHVRLTELGPVTVPSYIRTCPILLNRQTPYDLVLKRIEVKQKALTALDACRKAEGNPTLLPNEALKLCGQWRKTKEDKLSQKHIFNLINAGWLNADGDVIVNLDIQGNQR